MVKKIVFLFILNNAFFVYGLKVVSSVSENLVGVGERFSFLIQVISEDDVDISEPALPSDISPFEIENSWTSKNMSSNFSYPGGHSKEVRNNFYYQMYSNKEGKWAIGSVQVLVNGKSYSTNPTKVTVSSKVQKPPSPTSPPSVFDLFQNKQFFSYPFQRKHSISKDDLILKVHAPDRSAYLGEIIFARWNLYRKQGIPFSINLRDMNLVQPEGFWIEKISDPKSLQFSELENIKGESYLKAHLSSYVLFPLKTGQLKINPLKIKIQFHGISSFFSNQRSVIELESEPVVIEVLPLPEKAKGIFTGAIGSFIIESSVDRKEIFQNDILAYKIRFEGQGNIQRIQLPKWTDQDFFEVYDIVESQKFSIEKSWKEYEILLSPKKAGIIKTPLLVWTTFDPSLESYVSHELPSISINVLLPPEEQEKNEKFFNKKKQIEKKHDNHELSQEVQFEKFQPAFPFYQKYRWFFWVYFYLLIVAYIFEKNKKHLFKRKKNWDRILKKTFLLARNEKDRGHFRQTGIIILNLMDQIWLEITGVSGKQIHEILKKCPPSLRKNYGEDVRDIIKKLESISFAPHPPDDKNLKQDVEEIIDQCERLIPELLKYKMK